MTATTINVPERPAQNVLPAAAGSKADGRRESSVHQFHSIGFVDSCAWMPSEVDFRPNRFAHTAFN
jgi:hypothetical protein